MAGAGLLLLLAAAGLAVWLVSGRAEPEPPRGPLVGKRAPNVADGIEFWVNGDEVELDQLQGRPALLYFWHPRDGRSPDTLDQVNGLAKEFAGRGLVTIGLCVLEGPADVEPLVREHKLVFRVALDCDADCHVAYRIDKAGTPYCYLIDGARTVAWEGPPGQLSARRIGSLLP